MRLFYVVPLCVFVHMCVCVCVCVRVCVLPGVRLPLTNRWTEHLCYCFMVLFQVSGMLAIARPYQACKEIENVQELSGHIVILERGECMFVDKVSWSHILCTKVCEFLYIFLTGYVRK